MTRTAVLLLLPVMMAQTLPMEVRPGGQAGTVQFAIPGTAVPLVQEGENWVCTLEMVYRVAGGDGQVLDQATERIPLRLAAAQREALLAQALTITRPLPKVEGAAELRVEMTARPGGTRFAGAMGLATFQVDTNVALVPFQVEKGTGGFVSDLRADEIRVLEDGVAREAQLLVAGRQGPAAIPVDITLLHDRSGSMMVNGAYSAEVFRKGLLEEFPNVRIAIYGFSDALVQFTPHTRDEAALNRASEAVGTIAPQSTPLFSSISRTIAGFDLRRPAVRILIVFSDGVASMFDSGTYATTIEAARRAGVAIYPVLVATPSAARGIVPQPAPRRRTVARKKGQPEQPVNETADVEMRQRQQWQSGSMQASHSVAAYRKLAESGGQLLTVIPSGNSLPGMFAEIAKTLRYSYVASYRPSKGLKDVKVELVDKQRGKVIGGVRTVVR